MKNIYVYLFGTIHETKQEDILFDKLNNYFKQNHYKNIVWLCEGESDNRYCVSLKDYRVHLLSDALFVNMLINNNIYVTELYERIIELFITINRLNVPIIFSYFDDNILYLLKLFNNNLTKEKYENTKKKLQNMENKILFNQLKKSIKLIINYVLENYKLTNDFKNCIISMFENNNEICEDKILTNYRQQSIIFLILKQITNIQLNSKYNKNVIVVTIGEYHIKNIKIILEKYNIIVKKIVYSIKN
jgi:hypothetical protein